MRDQANFRSARVILEIMCKFHEAVDEALSLTNYRLLGAA